jgi:hypothetical protein
MKKDEMMVLALAGAAVFMILKAGGIKLPTLKPAVKSNWQGSRFVADDNSTYSTSGRAWFDPYQSAMDGGFIPQGL